MNDEIIKTDDKCGQISESELKAYVKDLKREYPLFNKVPESELGKYVNYLKCVYPSFDDNVSESELKEYIKYLARAYPSYVMAGYLGKGGSAEVFLCGDQNYYYQLSAVKVMRLKNVSWNEKKKEIEKIMYEFDLQHNFEGISVKTNPFPTVNENDPFFAVSMELMDGTLRDLLRKHKNVFDAVDTVQMMREISGLVEQLHNNRDLPEELRRGHKETSVAHFDLKPDNIFYKMENGRRHFKLGDYGCAHLSDTTQTRFGGTRAYYSNNAKNETGCARDIYALGIIMLELQGIIENPEQIDFRSQIMSEYKDNPVDMNLVAISEKACGKPEERYTIDEFIQELDNWLEAHADDVLIKEGDVDALLRKAASLAGSEDAEKYYEAAAEKGSGKAAYCLYQLLKDTDPERAEELLEKAEKLNYAPAVNEYVCIKIKNMGADGSLQDMAETAKLLWPVSSELPAAAYNLALFMKAGMIAEKSEGEADQLLKKAADCHFQAAVRLLDVLNHEITVQG